MSASANVGSGPGPITPDGCAVDFYAVLAPAGEAEIVHAAIPPGAAVLELGCGTGRILRGLAALGHPVLGVDESADMLARVHDLDTVRSRIEEVGPRTVERDGVRYTSGEAHRDGPLLTTTIGYEVGTRRWSHTFTTRRLTDEELAEALRRAGFGDAEWLTDDRTWLAAPVR